MQVIKESAARIASSTETSPMKSPESEGDKVVLLEKEIADMKKRFLSVAKKKQAEYAKRVHFPTYNQTSVQEQFWCPGSVFFQRGPLITRQTAYSNINSSIHKSHCIFCPHCHLQMFLRPAVASNALLAPLLYVH